LRLAPGISAGESKAILHDLVSEEPNEQL